ncbi:hypothetical protein [Aromatoleum evansii]|uniref:hypothetical protein n=1 Tax=Aromatoleum evansii TaxID=59406 RepID=UPI00145EDE5A|nr:hypothetical protein [Aromatoleum evansii]NMG28423.1 hypothetical protein [Aromatoleum evansii]
MKTKDMIASMRAGNFHRLEAAARMEALLTAVESLQRVVADCLARETPEAQEALRLAACAHSGS